VSLKSLARKVLERNNQLNAALNAGQNLVQSGDVQIEHVQTVPNLIPAPTAHPFGAPVDSEDWAEWIEERAAILEFDGYRSPQEALVSAYCQALEAWCAQHWEVPSADSCAACGASNPGFACGDGAAVCRRQDHACLIKYGTRRKRTAVEWLRQAGIESPDGWPTRANLIGVSM